MSAAEQSPHEPLVVLASSPGGLVAVIEEGRVLVLGAPDLHAIAEIGLVGALRDNDVAFAGDRLIVLERSTAAARLHVVDPVGPAKLAEVAFRAPVRLLAVAGTYVLVAGASGTSLIDVSRPHPGAVLLPLRGVVHAAGAVGTRELVLAAGGVIEHWSAEQRQPLRRLRLDQSIEPVFVGATADLVWMVPREAARIDVVALARRSQRSIPLAGPPSRVAASASGELLAVICGEERSTYLVDLVHDVPPMRIERGAMADVAWIGSRSLALQATEGSLELFAIPSTIEHGAPAPSATSAEPPAADEPEAVEDELGEEELPPTRWSREEISDRLASWRERARARGSGPASEPVVEPARAAPAEVPAALSLELSHPGGWRGELAHWAHAIAGRSYRPVPAITGEILDEVIARLELEHEARAAIALLYGAYLNGSDGVAPIDLAAVLEWRWDEAVGSGRLARSGALRRRRGRIALAREVIARLDERAPCTGTVVGSASATQVTVAVVAPSDVPMPRIGAWAAPVVGRLFVPDRAGEHAPKRLRLEARLRDAVPLVRAAWLDEIDLPPPATVVVVDDAGMAAGLGLAVAATWPASQRDRAAGR